MGAGPFPCGAGRSLRLGASPANRRVTPGPPGFPRASGPPGPTGWASTRVRSRGYESSCACRHVRWRRLRRGGRLAIAEAGHDVTGVHLALSANPRSPSDRRPRVLHDRGLARRLQGRRRDRHPLLHMGHGRAVPPRRGRGLRQRVRRRTHAQPVPALQREDQVRGGARPGPRAGLRRGGPPGTTRASRRVS